jgi:hypothetical protein
MSRTYKDSPHGNEARYRAGKGRQRHISVRSIRRDPPDLRRLSRAVIALAMAQAEAEAEAAREQADITAKPEELGDDS